MIYDILILYCIINVYTKNVLNLESLMDSDYLYIYIYILRSIYWVYR